MRLVYLVLVCLVVNCLGKEEESNEISTSQQPKINLDSNFRRALLKALTELENEASKEDQTEDLGEKTVERASASAVSVYTNGEQDDETVSSTVKNQILSSTTTTTEKAYVLVQKSDGITHKPITTIEHDDVKDDQILASESNSFQPPKKYNKVETTTVTTTTSTEESEAKVEDVQFFSAPLVAAFTVHQDETGVPKKVEPIYKVKKENERKENLLLAQEQDRKQQQQQQQQLVFEQDRFVLQQKRLEQEIAFLKEQQQRQEQLLKQHQLKEKLLQEQIRIRSNDEPFKPMIKAKPKEKDLSVVALQPSISFNPIVEAGRLPVNGQLLPIKNAIDFRSPFIQTPTFQQFHSVPHTSNPPPLLTAFEAFNGRPQLDLVPPQSNRILRQETNVGNFGFNQPSSNTFSIQPSIQSQSFSSLFPEQNRFFRSNFEQPNRFFRTNFEQSNRFNQRFQPPQANNYYLNNLLYNSGAVHGKPSEDFNIITKVLSLNHLGSDNRYAASSKNVEVRVPFYK